MALVTLTEAKAQLRVTNSLEDTLIGLYMDAADEWIASFLNVPQAPVLYRTKAAALLIIHDLYENRGATGEKEFKPNPAVESLLFPLRINMGI